MSVPFRPHVSFSEFGLFKNECQWRWKLDYLEGKRAVNYGVHLDFGTAIHAAIEVFKRRKDPVSVDEAVEEFRWAFCLLWGDNHEKYGANDAKAKPEDFLTAGERILRHMHECTEFWDTEVIYNEHKLDLLIDRSDGLTVKFKGYIDMVVRSKDKRGKPILYVIDFKSCSWGWDRKKREDKHLQSQLFLYKHFLCKKFNIDPEQVRCAFVLLKKRPKEGVCPVEFFPVSAGPVSVQRALDSFNSVLTEMNDRTQRNDFKKNRQSCVNPFGQRCPYYGTDLCKG